MNSVLPRNNFWGIFAAHMATSLRSSDYLITLDNQFFTESILVQATSRPLKIAKPGELREQLGTQRAV
jgi:hypothetical protein